MGIQLVTDSTADLPAELAEQLGIKVIPLYVNFYSESTAATTIETLVDGIDISPDEFYRRLSETTTLPTTSQPTVKDFLQVYQKLTENGDSVISIHISSKLSGTMNSATQAKRSLKNTVKIEVVDSLQASMALGLTVLTAAKSIHAGDDYDTVIRKIHKARSEIRILFMVDTLEYLQRGGRIGKAQAFLGSLLGIKAILTCKDGEVHPLERVRTRNKAILRLERLVEELSPFTDLCVVHNTTPDEAQRLRDNLGNFVASEKIIISRFGPVIGTHIGPGAIGIAALPTS